MATALLTQTVYNPPYGTDFTAQRLYFHGSLSFGAGSYITGGLMPNWNPTTGVMGTLQQANGENVLISGFTVSSPALITAVTVTGTTIVSSTKATPTLGQYVTFGGFTASTLVALNGITAQVTAVTAGVSFTTVITTTATTTTGQGCATTVIGPDTMWIQTVSGSGYQYSYNKLNGLIQIFTGAAAQSPLTELSAGALVAGITGDVIEFEAEYVRQ